VAEQAIKYRSWYSIWLFAYIANRPGFRRQARLARLPVNGDLLRQNSFPTGFFDDAKESNMGQTTSKQND
jgi:hypothetical protein